jgi:hypothetical protein
MQTATLCNYMSQNRIGLVSPSKGGSWNSVPLWASSPHKATHRLVADRLAFSIQWSPPKKISEGWPVDSGAKRNNLALARGDKVCLGGAHIW